MLASSDGFSPPCCAALVAERTVLENYPIPASEKALNCLRSAISSGLAKSFKRSVPLELTEYAGEILMPARRGLLMTARAPSSLLHAGVTGLRPEKRSKRCLRRRSRLTAITNLRSHATASISMPVSALVAQRADVLPARLARHQL